MYSKILVPTDGSDVSETALKHAIDLAEKYDAEVHGLYVVEVGRLEGMSLDVGGAIERLEADGQEFVAQIADAADASGLQATTEVRVGKPADTILGYVDDNAIDMVVMGTHGHSGLGRRLLGSVTEKVVRLADVPVHTVHHDDE
jgi:nucleotide-binding universal stress UspA family protein